jgi:hypothetical protein
MKYYQSGTHLFFSSDDSSATDTTGIKYSTYGI